MVIYESYYSIIFLPLRKVPVLVILEESWQLKIIVDILLFYSLFLDGSLFL